MPLLLIVFPVIRCSGTMASAADRRKAYLEIPDEKKQKMLAARRQAYKMKKQKSMVGGMTTTDNGGVLSHGGPSASGNEFFLCLTTLYYSRFFSMSFSDLFCFINFSHLQSLIPWIH